MSTTFLEPGGDADGGIGLWGSSTGSGLPPQVVTSPVNGGHIYSIAYNDTSSTSSEVLTGSVLTDAGGRWSVWMYLTAYPSATSTIMGTVTNPTGTVVIRLQLTTTGVLQLWDSVAQLGSSGATLSLNTWYRISTAWIITSSSVNNVNVWLNGASTITVTNATITTTGSTVFFIGNASGNGSLLMFSSDHYIDNSTALTDPGNIRVAAKRPVANGLVNGFTTQIGTSGSGYGTGHAPQVNELPLSITNGWSMVGAGSAVTEEYTVEREADGFINISGSNIVDFMGWVYASSLVGETSSIVVAGNTSNISLTSTNTMFEQIAGSTTYPLGGADIGIVTTTALTTVSLYEAGIVIAYIPKYQSNMPGNIGRFFGVENGMSISGVAN